MIFLSQIISSLTIRLQLIMKYVSLASIFTNLYVAWIKEKTVRASEPNLSQFY